MEGKAKLKVFVTPYFGHKPFIDMKHWLGFYSWVRYSNSVPEIYINSKRFFLFQIITFIHELGHYIIDIYPTNFLIRSKLNMILERTTIPIYYPEKRRGVYLQK